MLVPPSYVHFRLDGVHFLGASSLWQPLDDHGCTNNNGKEQTSLNGENAFIGTNKASNLSFSVDEEMECVFAGGFEWVNCCQCCKVARGEYSFRVELDLINFTFIVRKMWLWQSQTNTTQQMNKIAHNKHMPNINTNTGKDSWNTYVCMQGRASYVLTWFSLTIVIFTEEIPLVIAYYVTYHLTLLLGESGRSCTRVPSL